MSLAATGVEILVGAGLAVSTTLVTADVRPTVGSTTARFRRFRHRAPECAELELRSHSV